ncbi:unnamed protein product [Dovyalis caffra]|uniref:Stress response NST1-like protein n=1 Tax=Dovyalis caffra TaxID=77055 RepID=A0AAV1RW74_9ROSI|nr:unnamed protein product [Dovyalis caffra]
MERQETHSNNKNGETSAPDTKTDVEKPYNSKTLEAHESQYFTEDFDSTCSTPYVSAPSSPGRPGSGPVNGGFFYSCPASPMHFAITSSAASFASSPDNTVPIGYEFEFSARFGSTGSGQPGSMSSADELFLNGQIRPMRLSSHLERPQVLAPLLDLENEEEDGDISNEDEFKKGSRKVDDNGESMSRGRDLRLKNKSLRRRTRSMSPLRSTSFEFEDYEEENKSAIDGSSTSLEVNGESLKLDEATTSGDASTPSVSASSSRSSSAGRNSKRWVFLKDFLYRSKSEGRSTNKFWSNISFSPAKEKSKQQSGSVQFGVSKEKASNKNNGSNAGGESQKVKGNSGQGSSSSSGKKPVNGVGKRRVPTSPHELHYKASRAQAEEMRKKTFLPYRQGLLGCLGFSSKGYGAMNGFARALNPVSSR